MIVFIPDVQNGAEVSKGHILRLMNATYDTAGTYVCVVTVPEIEGMETTGTLKVNVQGECAYRPSMLSVYSLMCNATFNVTFCVVSVVYLSSLKL